MHSKSSDTNFYKSALLLLKQIYNSYFINNSNCIRIFCYKCVMKSSRLTLTTLMIFHHFPKTNHFVSDIPIKDKYFNTLNSHHIENWFNNMNI